MYMILLYSSAVWCLAGASGPISCLVPLPPWPRQVTLLERHITTKHSLHKGMHTHGKAYQCQFAFLLCIAEMLLVIFTMPLAESMHASAKVVSSIPGI